MEHGQLMIKSIIKQMMRPSKLVRLPLVLRALFRSVDTDIPIWLWPRLAFMVLRLGTDGIDNRTINRDMVTPFTTSEGAQVLAPNWELINPVVDEMFRK
jgi:anionic cell wall polymer biosynthesis LytR-Cps2A-Psr (LCP) family protein